MNTSRWFLTATVAVALCGHSAMAGEVGDNAKPLKIAKWVKGQEVDLAEGKGQNIYVVEFWATWCGPCRQSIPHLTELQAKYKDKGVVVIGVSDEEVSTVKSFVKEQGSKMNYTVAVDEAGGTAGGYSRAFGINGIPHAFIVDKAGKIAWYGHPMGGLDRALDQIVAGEYDIKLAVKAGKARGQMKKFEEFATTKGHQKKADKIGEQIVEDGASDAALMNEFATLILSNDKIVKPNYALAAKAGKAAFEASEGRDADIIAIYALALTKNGQAAEAAELKDKAVRLAADDTQKKQIEAMLSNGTAPKVR